MEIVERLWDLCENGVSISGHRAKKADGWKITVVVDGEQYTATGLSFAEAFNAAINKCLTDTQTSCFSEHRP